MLLSVFDDAPHTLRMTGPAMRNFLTNFTNCQRGNIAMMFGLILIPMLIAGGVAIDMARAAHLRAVVTESSDAGLLAAVRTKMRDGTLSDAAAEVIAKRYFEANGAAVSDFDLHSLSFSNPGNADDYRLEVTGRIKTSLLKVTGRDWLDMTVVSEAKVTPPRDLEVALVLDNTYSMTGSKMTALKNAADDLVDTIMADVDNKVKVGLVPFSQYVNIGLSRRNASWLDVADDYAETEQRCRNTYPDRSESNCRTVTETCSRTRDGVTTTWSCQKRRCDVDRGDPVWKCTDRTKNYVWRGCVGSRENPYDYEDSGYATRKVPGLLNIHCAQELTTLTTSKTRIRADIASMAVQGDQTYIPTGLNWGYRLLSSQEPFSQGITYNEMNAQRAIKAIVLMSDGENTRSANYSKNTHTRNDGGSRANTLFDNLCDEAKGDGIRIYTIAFEVTDASVRNMLQDCATSSASYYNATNAAALADAFEEIGGSLYDLALTK